MEKRIEVTAEVVAVMCVCYSVVTIAEPLLFHDQFPLKNIFLVAMAAIGVIMLPKRDLLHSTPFALVVLFFGIAGISMALQNAYLLDAMDTEGRSAQDFVLSVLIYSGLCFAAGLSLPLLMKSRLIGPLATAAALITMALFLANTDGIRIHWNSIIYPDGSSPSHLTIDEAATLTFFIAFVAIRSHFRYIFAVGLLICLFFGGSRASLILTMVAFGGAELVQRRNLGGQVYFGALAALLAIVLLSQNSHVAFLYDSLFPTGIAGDDSMQARNEAFHTGAYDLIGQFWIGDPVLIIQSFGSLGLYMHNILSAWQFYGFPAFLILATGIGIACMRAIHFNYSHRGRRYLLGFLLIIYAVAGAFTSKFVGVYSLWMALGFWSAVALGGSARFQASDDAAGEAPRMPADLTFMGRG